MKLVITESKIKNLVFNYLNKSQEFKGVDEFRTGYKNLVRVFGSSECFDDDVDCDDYDKVLTYYQNKEMYEDFNDVISPYPESDFPLIELDYRIYDLLSNLFGEKIINEFVKDWLNEKFELDSIKVTPN